MALDIGVDAHLHLWDRERFTYPWLEEAGDAMPSRYLPDSLDAGDARPDSLVFVQADCLPEQGIAEAAWASSLVGAWGPRGAVVAFAPIELPTRAQWLDELGEVPLVSGIRRLLQDETTDFIRSAELSAGLRMLGLRSLTFDACVRFGQLPALAELVTAAPDTLVVLDHLGKPPVKAGWASEDAREWKRSIDLLAARPSVFVKLSGLALEAADAPLLEQSRPFLEAAIQAFGADRAMIGSDFPVSAAPPNAVPYGTWFEFVASLGTSEDERGRLLGGTAATAYFH